VLYKIYHQSIRILFRTELLRTPTIIQKPLLHTVSSNLGQFRRNARAPSILSFPNGRSIPAVTLYISDCLHSYLVPQNSSLLPAIHSSAIVMPSLSRSHSAPTRAIMTPFSPLSVAPHPSSLQAAHTPGCAVGGAVVKSFVLVTRSLLRTSFHYLAFLEQLRTGSLGKVITEESNHLHALVENVVVSYSETFNQCSVTTGFDRSYFAVLLLFLSFNLPWLPLK